MDQIFTLCAKCIYVERRTYKFYNLYVLLSTYIHSYIYIYTYLLTGITDADMQTQAPASEFSPSCCFPLIKSGLIVVNDNNNNNNIRQLAICQ